MAKAAIENEKLGKRPFTDFLAISCSSTDYIGHKFGVNAVETEDAYLRLDKDLAGFLNYLDKTIGRGQYLLFLTSDHGAAHNALFLKDHKMPSGYWPTSSVLRSLNKKLEEQFHTKNLISSFSNLQLHLDEEAIIKGHLDQEMIRRVCVEFLNRQEGVAYVVDIANTEGSAVPGEVKERIINGYNKDRSGVISIILKPGWYPGIENATGTAHGAWNPYDAHTPLIWLGWGIPKGSSNRVYHITDIAPTLAALLHIQEPNGNIGKPIEEILINNNNGMIR